MSVYQGSNLIAGGSSLPSLFDFKWADHQLNDISWLRADTFSWQNGTVYTAAYQHLVNDYNNIPEPDWTQAVQNSNLGSHTWLGITWNGSKFVAIGYSGYISTSTDGTNWTQAVQNSNLGMNDWFSIAWDGSKFVAIGNSGHISTSTDGTTWTPAVENTNLGTYSWYGIAWDGSKFVAIGNYGHISTSTDGTTWTQAVENTNLGLNDWHSIAWDGSKFVAIGNYGHISTSTDGTNWTQAVQNSNLGSHSWYRIAWNGSKFVAIGSTGYISTSTDGTTWTQSVQNSNLGSHSWYGIACNGSKFVAIGYSGYISTLSSSAQSETISGITITYYEAQDGHKICLSNQESNILALYNATGVAWYYILDTVNQRFKLPRSKHEHYGNRPVIGNGMTVGWDDGTKLYGIRTNSGTLNYQMWTTANYGASIGTSASTDSQYPSSNIAIGITSDPTKSGIISTPVQDTDQYKYLYFYVGQFSQSATEQTAGLNAELFNGKQDVLTGVSGGGDYVVSWQDPTVDNDYTWYRKYKSGWVEQGGYSITGTYSSLSTTNLLIAMSDTNYALTLGAKGAGNYTTSVAWRDKTTTGFTTEGGYNGGNAEARDFNWQVSGIAA